MDINKLPCRFLIMLHKPPLDVNLDKTYAFVISTLLTIVLYVDYFGRIHSEIRI